ncbi:hypothetical protein VKT23_019371 [Stygiomarasmius scandens]|uniref:Uncharacterized protein n=1 Tax=Marasmiellus scandens TaxID=2682957 RepID=A0ABR1INZ1_9AGAR
MQEHMDNSNLMTEELLVENHYRDIVHAIVQGKHPPPPPQPVIPEDAPFPIFPPDSLEHCLLNYDLSTYKGVMAQRSYLVGKVQEVAGLAHNFLWDLPVEGPPPAAVFAQALSPPPGTEATQTLGMRFLTSTGCKLNYIT